MTMRTVCLHLALIENVGPAAVRRVLEILDGDPELAYRLSIRELMVRARLSEPTASLIVGGLSDRKLLEKELVLLEKGDCQWLTMLDAEYPQNLSAIHLPPPVLTWRGSLPDNKQPLIAFVGSRIAGSYAQDVLSNLVRGCVEMGMGIVSGGAYGADAMAHEVALEAGGATFAVIGSGLENPYPPRNGKIFRRIVEQGGAVISPFAYSMPSLPYNFPARNRIIAGMSRMTIVVQAAERSGALITAKYALEENREVGAVPGRIDDPLSVGCHGLLKDGAQMITCVADIAAAMGMHVQAEQLPLFHAAKVDMPENLLVKACRTPKTFDALIDVTGYDAVTLQDQLLDLQLEGRLEQDFAGQWRCKF